MGVLYCWIYVFFSCLRAPRKIDSSIGLPSLNKVVTYLLTYHFSLRSLLFLILSGCFTQVLLYKSLNVYGKFNIGEFKI